MHKFFSDARIFFSGYASLFCDRKISNGFIAGLWGVSAPHGFFEQQPSSRQRFRAQMDVQFLSWPLYQRFVF